jgi:radical SAM protein with 4Fe4S-binding SPASM domain
MTKVPMTESLRRLLDPRLHGKEPIFTGELEPPAPGEKVYSLAPEEVRRIRELRGATVDLHPGMGGIAPETLIEMIRGGTRLTSLDFMITKGCNFECTWCFAGSGPRQSDFLPFSVLRRITEEAAELGVKLFVLTGGEPLVYRDPALGRPAGRGDHFFQVVEMIHEVYADAGVTPKLLTFDDVALVTPEVARRFADLGVGLCTKGDTLIAELQDYKVNQVGAFEKMQAGYRHLKEVGYGDDARLRLVVNSVLDHTTFDGMLDLHLWVMENGWDHSIVPVHYCGNAEEDDQEVGIHSPHVKVLYDLLARIDEDRFGISWTPYSAFTYNKTCNRNRSGLHVRADGEVTACSESPGREATDRYTFGNVLGEGFSLREVVEGRKLTAYREEFATGYGTYVCSPEVCDLYANDLCQGGCATRSAYSRVDREQGLITRNSDPENYSRHREDPLCPAWTELAIHQGKLRPGLLEEIHARLLARSERIAAAEYPYGEGCPR